MTDTSFGVTIDVTVEAFNRNWNVTATVTPKGWDCEPAVMWVENKDRSAGYFVPEQVWDAVDAQLADMSSPSRIAFDAAMNKAPVPFLAAAE